MSLARRGRIYHYSFSINGQLYRGTTKQTDINKAKRVERDRMIEAQSDGFHPLHGKRETLEQAAMRFTEQLAREYLGPKTKAYYKNGCRLLSETSLWSARVDRITSEMTRTMYISGSPSNANCALRTLKRIFRKAESWGLVYKAISVPLRKEQARTRIPTIQEKELLIASADPLLRDVLILLFDGGYRPSEAMRLKWRDINWELRLAFVREGKTNNAARQVPLSDRDLEMLFRRQPISEFVFPGRNKKKPVQWLNYAFRRARVRAGLDADIVMYSARHHYGTYTLKESSDLAGVMNAMGHASPVTTMRYLHPGVERVREAVNRLNAAIS